MVAGSSAEHAARTREQEQRQAASRRHPGTLLRGPTSSRATQAAVAPRRASPGPIARSPKRNVISWSGARSTAATASSVRRGGRPVGAPAGVPVLVEDDVVSGVRALDADAHGVRRPPGDRRRRPALRDVRLAAVVGVVAPPRAHAGQATLARRDDSLWSRRSVSHSMVPTFAMTPGSVAMSQSPGR